MSNKKINSLDASEVTRSSAKEQKAKPAEQRPMENTLPALHVVAGAPLSEAVFLDVAAISLHASGIPLISVYRRANELLEARRAFLKGKQ